MEAAALSIRRVLFPTFWGLRDAFAGDQRFVQDGSRSRERQLGDFSEEGKRTTVSIIKAGKVLNTSLG
ncbi:MAG TPA: hypothetical protein VJM51_00285, partial [Dehalococcoidia bacterium]|nr:hypothetical protein [Dehalococcoidia bacterium]